MRRSSSSGATNDGVLVSTSTRFERSVESLLEQALFAQASLREEPLRQRTSSFRVLLEVFWHDRAGQAVLLVQPVGQIDLLAAGRAEGARWKVVGCFQLFSADGATDVHAMRVRL